MKRWETRRQGFEGASEGFSLLELLLSMAIGLTLCGAMVQMLQADGRLSGTLARRMSERSSQRRTLELIRSEVQRAEAVRGDGDSSSLCGLGGRRVALELDTLQGTITYTVGAAPSGIWRGEVLMRCGPAYGLHGEPSAGMAQNRVLIDALPEDGLQVEELGEGRLRLRLRQQVPGGGGTQLIDSELTIAGRGVAD